MSRIIRFVLIAVVVALPGGASAQTHESAAAATLHARLDSLVPAWQAARERMAKLDSISKAQESSKQREALDTMKIGPVIAVARHSESAGIFRRARRELARREDLLTGLEHAEPVTLLLDGTGQYLQFRELLRAPRHHIITLNQGEFSISSRVLSLGIDEALRDFMSNDVRRWLGDGRMNFDNDYADVYRIITLSDVALAKRCLHEDSQACIGALELVSRDSLRGHTPAEIQRAAVATLQMANTPLDQAHLCANKADIRACLDILADRGGVTPPVPLVGRASVLYYALRRGGSGALARMSNFQEPAQAIAAAAKEPLDKVLAGWQAELNAQGANPQRGVASGAASTILWAGVALAFALRSTRGRVG